MTGTEGKDGFLRPSADETGYLPEPTQFAGALAAAGTLQLGNDRMIKIKAVEGFLAPQNQPHLLSFRKGQAFYALNHNSHAKTFFVSTEYATPFSRTAVNGFVPDNHFVVIEINTGKNKGQRDAIPSKAPPRSHLQQISVLSTPLKTPLPENPIYRHDLKQLEIELNNLESTPRTNHSSSLPHTLSRPTSSPSLAIGSTVAPIRTNPSTIQLQTLPPKLSMIRSVSHGKIKSISDSSVELYKELERSISLKTVNNSSKSPPKKLSSSSSILLKSKSRDMLERFTETEIRVLNRNSDFFAPAADGWGLTEEIAPSIANLTESNASSSQGPSAEASLSTTHLPMVIQNQTASESKTASASSSGSSFLRRLASRFFKKSSEGYGRRRTISHTASEQVQPNLSVLQAQDTPKRDPILRSKSFLMPKKVQKPVITQTRPIINTMQNSNNANSTVTKSHTRYAVTGAKTPGAPTSVPTPFTYLSPKSASSHTITSSAPSSPSSFYGDGPAFMDEDAPPIPEIPWIYHPQHFAHMQDRGSSINPLSQDSNMAIRSQAPPHCDKEGKISKLGSKKSGTTLLKSDSD